MHCSHHDVDENNAQLALNNNHTLMSSKNTKEEIKEEGHAIQRTKEMAQKDKQLSTEHYTENKRLNNPNPIKHRGQIKCYGSVSSS